MLFFIYFFFLNRWKKKNKMGFETRRGVLRAAQNNTLRYQTLSR